MSVASTVDVSAERHNPTMAGLTVQPVHGRHCICHRCERLGGAGR